jgi:hypothetical protein
MRSRPVPPIAVPLLLLNDPVGLLEQLAALIAGGSGGVLQQLVVAGIGGIAEPSLGGVLDDHCAEGVASCTIVGEGSADVTA